MAIKVPRGLRAFNYDYVMPADLNSFDVDLLLPSLFFKAITGGKSWGRRADDPEAIREYADALALHEDVSGFGDQRDARFIERLTRTSLVSIGFRGTSRVNEQIEGLVPYSLAAFKPEFPSEHSRLRRVDALVYRMLKAELKSDTALRSFFEEIFGKGLTVRGGNEPFATYDGHTTLDTMTRLSIAYAEGFEATGVRTSSSREYKEALPSVAAAMAQDFRRYLAAYRAQMPTEALTYHFLSLINFELFVYSQKLFAAVSQLVENPDELPPAMMPELEASDPELYVDFTGAATGLNRVLAAACVRRDLEQIQRFVAANLTLRQLDRYLHEIRDPKTRKLIEESLGEEKGGPEYLQAMLKLLAQDSVAIRVDSLAERDEDVIRAENGLSDEDRNDVAEIEDELERIAAHAESSFERVILLILDSQRKKFAQNLIAWFWSVGGLQKTHGILTGHLKSRQSWRYAPSNDLLATLVQLAAVDIPEWDEGDPRPRPIKLRDFLSWLERRFGIIVDRPPAGFEGAEYVAAAQENLRAMLRRLQQMGVFRDLSDDFTVQRLIPPYVVEETVHR